jgi:hypothetical protein
MKRFSVLVALAFITPALAQFTATNPNQTLTEQFHNGSFECVPVFLWPRERDNDPIYKITVVLDWDNTSLMSMGVVHNSIADKIFVRSDQYSNDYLAQTPNHLEINWRGSWVKNSNVLMNGRLWNEAGTTKWYYSETQTRNGYDSMKMRSVCHSIPDQRS